MIENDNNILQEETMDQEIEAELEKELNEPDSDIEKDNKELDEDDNYETDRFEEFEEFEEIEDNEESKKKTKLALVGILALAVIAVVLFFGKGTVDPVDRLLAGYKNILVTRQFSANVDASVTIDPENQSMKDTFAQIFSQSSDDYLKLTSSLAPNYRLMSDVHMDLSQGNFTVACNPSLIYKDKAIVDGKISFRPWEMSVSSNRLLDRPVYGDITGIIMDARGIDVKSLDLVKYSDIVFEPDEFITSLPSSEYITALKEVFTTEGENPLVKEEGEESISYLGESITADKITITFTYEDVNQLMQKYKELASADEVLKQAVLSKFDKIVEVMTNNSDYKVLDMEMVDFLAKVDTMRTDINDNWQQVVNDTFEKYEKYYSELEEETKTLPMTHTYYMQGDAIKKVVMSTNYDGYTVALNVDYIGYTPEAIVFATEDVDDFTVIDDSEFTAKLIANMYNNVLVSDEMTAMLSDIKTEGGVYLPADQSTKVNNTIDSLMGIMRFYVNFVLDMPVTEVEPVAGNETEIMTEVVPADNLPSEELDKDELALEDGKEKSDVDKTEDVSENENQDQVEENKENTETEEVEE